MKIIRSNKLRFVPASHEDPKDPGVLKKVLLKKDDIIEGRIRMINWAKLPRGKSFQAHFHEDMEEVFIILKGSAKITIDKKSEIIQEGDTVVIPVRGVHTMENVGDVDVEYIAMGISKGKDGKTVVV